MASLASLASFPLPLEPTMVLAARMIPRGSWSA